jgi:hypothetical protein
VFALPSIQPDGEFNGAGPYLRGLNRGSEVVPGVKFLALRSDSLDKYAQADGAGLGMKGTPTGVDATGPALRGALNVVLPGTDHREVAFGPAAFRAQYRFITGRAPTHMDIVADTVAVLEGMISGHVNASPTNLPLANAVITVHAVDATTGQRLGAPAYRAVTSHTGRWGPFRASPGARYEFEVASPDSTVILHVFRMPFPRSSRLVNFRFPAPPAARADSVSVLIARPRGYLGFGRDTVEFEGARAAGIPPGVPTVDRAIRWFGARDPLSVRTRVNGETIVVRTQPGDKRRLVWAEFQRE